METHVASSIMATVHFEGRFPQARPQPVAPSSPRAVPAGVVLSIPTR